MTALRLLNGYRPSGQFPSMLAAIYHSLGATLLCLSCHSPFQNPLPPRRGLACWHADSFLAPIVCISIRHANFDGRAAWVIVENARGCQCSLLTQTQTNILNSAFDIVPLVLLCLCEFTIALFLSESLKRCAIPHQPFAIVQARCRVFRHHKNKLHLVVCHSHTASRV